MLPGRASIRQCSFRTVRRRIPAITWLPSYDFPRLRGDIIAGLAVGLMTVPQSLAIATVAGLPPHYGLYSSFPGPFVYFLLGTSKDLNVGPTMICALVVSRYNTYQNPALASILAFTSGVVLTLAGFLNLGFVIRFISTPVFGAFIAASAISISINQLQDLLGLPPGPRPVFQRLWHIFKNIKETRTGDAILGTTSLLILMSLGVLARYMDRTQHSKNWPKMLRKAVALLNIGKSALIAVLATIVSYLFFMYGNENAFKTAGKLPDGFPQPQNPLREVQVSTNKTLTVLDSLTSFGAGIGIVPLISYIENIAVAKALAMKNQCEVDSSQELVAVGSCNIIASFFNAFPITGSFARSAVNSSSGAATPISGLFAAIVVILALQFITPVFQYIPVAALAAMVTASVLSMLDFKLPKELWARDRVELLPYLASFCASFYQMELGIIIGAGVSLCILMYKIMNPRLLVDEIGPETARLHVKGPLWFPSSEIISGKLQNILASWQSRNRANFDCFEIQIDCSNATDIDYTFALKLQQKIVELEANGVKVVLINVTSLKMKNILKKNEILFEEAGKSEAGEMQKLVFETSV